jgi:hypothetical protein
MMELTMWQQGKILITKIDRSILKDNVISSKLLNILGIQNEQRATISENVSEQVRQMTVRLFEGFA